MNQIPKYKARITLRPAAHARVRHETPFSSQSESDVWQYADRVIEAGEVFESEEWPHASLTALNEPAQRIQAYFAVAIRSRLPRSPFRDGRLVLDDGMTGNAIGHVPGPSLPKAFGGKTAA